MLCYYMILRCLVEAKDYTEAANIINSEINPTSCNVSLQQDVKSHDNLTYFNVCTNYTIIFLMLKLKFKQVMCHRFKVHCFVSKEKFTKHWTTEILLQSVTKKL